jgi:hypothetical protein
LVSYFWYNFKLVWPLSKLISKTLLNTKRRISLRGSFVYSKEKHLKEGEKISNLENASQNLIYIPLTICKKTLKKNFQNICKTKQVVHAWSKMLKWIKQSMHILWMYKLVQFQVTFALTFCKLVQLLHLYICFGLCWHQSPKRGRLKGK